MRANCIAINFLDSGDLAFLRELLANRGGRLLSERSIEKRITSESQQRRSHPLGVFFRAKQPIPSVLDHLRDTAVTRCDYRQSARHRLEHRVGNALDIPAGGFAWMQENVRAQKEALQRALRKEARKPHSPADSKIGG